MLLIRLGMVLPKVAARWSLCSIGSFAARSMHDMSISAGMWHPLGGGGGGGGGSELEHASIAQDHKLGIVCPTKY